MREIFFYQVIVFLLSTQSIYAADDPTMRVTLLGTGSPQPAIDRFSQSTLVEVGDLKVLIDAGRGVPIRLTQAGVALSDIDAVFITHFHHDHINGLADLLITSWLATPFGNRQVPLDVYGPQGMQEITDGLKAAYSRDSEIRIADEGLPRAAGDYNVTEFTSSGIVFDQDGLKVTSFEVDHGELIKPTYGYRLDYEGKSVLISGDTKYDERIITAGVGVDLLIHEVAIAPPALIQQFPQLAAVFDHHTNPAEAGRIFSAVQPKLAVYSHIVTPGPTGPFAVSTEDLIEQTRATYQGPLLVGEDLTVIEVGDSVTFKKH